MDKADINARFCQPQAYKGRPQWFPEETILQLHKLSRGDVWDAGQYKNQPVDIIELLLLRIFEVMPDYRDEKVLIERARPQ